MTRRLILALAALTALPVPALAQPAQEQITPQDRMAAMAQEIQADLVVRMSLRAELAHAQAALAEAQVKIKALTDSAKPETPKP